MDAEAEAVTEAFYRFELRGRGWYGSKGFVMLEPAYEPFQLPHLVVPNQDRPRDDGKRPSLFGNVLARLGGAVPPQLPAPQLQSESWDVPVVDAPEREDFAVLDLRVPSGYVSRPESSARLLQALRAVESPLSFELIGTKGKVHVQLSAGESDVPHLTETLAGYYPDVSLIPGPDRLIRALDDNQETFVVDFGLSNEFFLPLASAKSFTIDPLISLVSALTIPQEGEFLALQVLFEKVRNPWREAVRSAMVGPDGTCIFGEHPDFLKAAFLKTETPLFAAVLRVGAQAKTESQAKRLAARVEAFIAQFGSITGNHLIPLSNEHYDDDSHRAAFLLRETHRAGMLLSTEELSSIVHVPDASVRQPALIRTGGRTKKAPSCDAPQGQALHLGTNTHRGITTEVSLDPVERLAHMHVVGASGTGKSTLLLSAALQDIDAGHGVVVLDPHGDLIDDILLRVPEDRLSDIILFDPSEANCPVGINILHADTEGEREHLASDVVGMFRRLATSWGDSMGSVLANAVLAIVESQRGGTLLDLRRFLIDPATRQSYLAEVADEEVRFFWEKSFSLIGTRSIGPILTKLDSFLRSKTMRRVVGVPRSTFDWEEVLSGRRILLAKLSLGLLGEDNASLLGSLLVSQLHQAALRRQQVGKELRSPAFVYVDEFQHFVTPSMASLLSEGRKYAVGLVLAHQTLAQMSGSGVENAVMGNASTRLIFRVGDADAGKLASGLSFFTAPDLLNLGRGQAVARLGSAERDCNLTTAPPSLPLRSGNPISWPTVEPEPDDPNDEEEVQEDHSSAPSRSGLESSPSSSPDAFLPVIHPKSRHWGAEHKYLAQVVARLGQERGFRAIHEEPVSGGRVDVSLRRADLAIACEISVSTEVTHELGNARKCLAAGFQHVVLIATDEGKRSRLHSASAELGRPEIRVCSPEELAQFLDTLQVPEAGEKLVRGYKVRVNRQKQSPDEAAKRRDAVGKVMAQSIKKE